MTGPRSSKEKSREKTVDEHAEELSDERRQKQHEDFSDLDLDLKDFIDTKHIEFLLQQSTLGIHFLFDNSDVAKIMGSPIDDRAFFKPENMTKVQSLLSGLLERPSMSEKKMFLERLSPRDFELLVRAYFHLLDRVIDAHSSIRH